MNAAGVELSVVHVVDTLRVGGLESVAVAIANGCADAGIRAGIYATRAGGPLTTRISAEVSCAIGERKRLLDLQSVWRFTRYMRDSEITIAHAHGTSVFFVFLAKLLMWPRLKIVWHVHSGAITRGMKWKLLSWTAARFADRIIVVSRDIERWFVDSVGAEPRQIVLMENFVTDCQRPGMAPVRPPDAPCRIVCVANFRREKAQHLLVAAFEDLRRTGRSANLVLVGGRIDEAYADEVADAARASAFAADITIVDDCASPKTMLLDSDVGVLCSDFEGLPLSLLEYGSAGLAVVVTDVGECGRIVRRNGGGLVIPAKDQRALSAALSDLTDDPVLRNRMGLALRATVRDLHSAEAAMAVVRRVYESLVESITGVRA